MRTIAYLYRWTELSTGKWYEGSRTGTGCHPDDGYICSSGLVKALIKNNRGNWKREILVIGDQAYIRELENKRLISLDAARDPMSYNRDNGNGSLGFSSIGKRWMALNDDEVLVEKKMWQHYLNDGWKFGRNNIIKQRLSEANSDNAGENNPAYGRKWMTNGEINRLADEHEQKELISEGWYYGIDTDTKKKIGIGTKSYYQTRSIEKEQQHNSALSNATTNYHRRLTPEEYVERSRKCSLGTLNAYNNMSQEQKNVIIRRLNDPSKQCEYCDIKVSPGNYSRWHGEKCKRKNK